MSAGDSKLQNVRGLNLDVEDLNLNTLIESLISTGGQATEVGKARQLLEEVFAQRKACDAAGTKQGKPFVFLGYTSNMISCGLRESFKHLAQHSLVDVIVTTGGGVEEDFIKCKKDTYVYTEFTVNDRKWRLEGKNRIGNMVMPNDNYVDFEEWFSERYNEMVIEQRNGKIFGPSDMIKYLAERIDNETSVYHWCAKNGIEIFSPGVTDGSLGDILYCKGFSDDHFILDINRDLSKFVGLARQAVQDGRPLVALLVGAGLVKYHVLLAAKMAGGLDQAVFVSVGSELDNSCSGARPSQDIGRRAIKPTAKVVSVNYEASIVLPMILAGITQDA